MTLKTQKKPTVITAPNTNVSSNSLNDPTSEEKETKLSAANPAADQIALDRKNVITAKSKFLKN